MISKFTIVLCLVAAAAASVIPSNESSYDLVFNYNNNLSQKSNPNARYHIVLGSRLHDDVVQFQESVQGKSGIKVRFNINPYLVINSVLVMDSNSKGNGDFPLVVDGGIDKNYITLQFLSESGQNIDFFVSIYGH